MGKISTATQGWLAASFAIFGFLWQVAGWPMTLSLWWAGWATIAVLFFNITWHSSDTANVPRHLKITTTIIIVFSFLTIASQYNQGAILLELNPHVVVKRRPNTPEIRRPSYYGFSVVLHATNTTRTAKKIGQLEIIGEVAARYQDYQAAFGREGDDWNDIARDHEKRKPYHRIHLIANPQGEGRLESGFDERFIKFRFLNPRGFRNAGSSTTC